MFESSETFTAYATIDAGMYMLQELNKEINKPEAPIVKMINNVTGYGKDRDSKWIKSSIIILKDIINAKKVIEVDYSNDEAALQQLKKLLKSNEQSTKASTKDAQI